MILHSALRSRPKLPNQVVASFLSLQDADDTVVLMLILSPGRSRCNTALSSEEEIVDPVRLEVEEAAAPAQENVDVLHETSSQDPQVQQTEIALAQTGGQAVPAGDPTDEKLGKSLPEISTSAEDHELGVEQERPGSCSETAEVTTDDSVQFPVSSSPAEVVTSSLSEASPQARENGDAAHKDLETEGVSEAVKDTVLPPEETSNGDSNGALTNGNAYEHSAHDPQSPEANGEDLSKQVQMLEAALQGAARQAQVLQSSGCLQEPFLLILFLDKFQAP